VQRVGSISLTVPALSELFTLAGRVAIVTGGSRGLGLEMAEGLAEAGASLMLCARRAEWLTPAVTAMRAQGFTVDGMLCDVSKADDVQAVVDATVARFGKVDILVTNTGGPPAAAFLDLTESQWQDGVNGTLMNVVRLSKQGKRDEAHDLFDAHLPLIRYEQQPGPGLAVRKYVMMRRGIIASDTLRKPGAALSPTARAEVDYLLARLAQKDSRAKV